MGNVLLSTFAADSRIKREKEGIQYNIVNETIIIDQDRLAVNN